MDGRRDPAPAPADLVTAPALEGGATGLPQLGDYEIVRLLGRGGMASVYLARQVRLDRLVAVKQLAAIHAGDPQLAARFMRESRLAGSLTHPNVVAVYEYLEDRGVPYIVMEYMPRGSLRPLLGGLTDLQAVGVLDDVLAGLTAAARRGVVHRDLKPENVLVAADGRVKIADFGVAKAVDALQADGFHTGAGVAVGTPSYMAPEQVEGSAVSGRTDLYSVGVMAYELFAGQLPFSREGGTWAVLRRHLDERPVPLSQHRPDLDTRLVDWVHALLSRRPEDRPEDAQVARERLEDVAVEVGGPRWRRCAALAPEDAQPTPSPAAAQAEPPRRVGRSPRASAAFALTAVLLAGTVASLRPDPGPRTGEERTRPAREAAELIAPAAAAARELSEQLERLRPGRADRGAQAALRSARAATVTVRDRLRTLRGQDDARALVAAHERYLEHVGAALAPPVSSRRLAQLEAAAEAVRRLTGATDVPLAAPTRRAVATLVRTAKARSRVRLSAPRTVSATTVGGAAPVRFEVRARRDGKAVDVRCRPASGSAFPPGRTRVVCASGRGEHRARRSFTVQVRVVRPPAPPTVREEPAPPSSGSAPVVGVDEG